MTDDTEDLPAETTEPAAPAGEHLRRGASLGRYVLLERLGEGGMGVVYAADDPELRRRVAVKLVREEAALGAAGERLLREARALARLSHPNVIAVHDVGALADQVFIAMELLEGGTLGDWLAARPRGWREIVDVFVQAGRGLAHAHAAGIVHRDFKPSNVLLSKDGRVCVTDFGLARAEAVEPGREPSADSPAPLYSLAGGTPAYMAPEQILGKPIGPPADQFGFCVTLHEALYGQRPFVPDSELSQAPLALGVEVVQGRVRPPQKGAAVPAWLRRIVLRGLSVAPEQRFPSMGALLGELVDVPRRSRRRRWLGLGLAAVAAAAGLVLGPLRDPRPACEGGERKLAGVWDAARKAQVRAAFTASEAPFAEDAWASVERTLDAYARGWLGRRKDACEASVLRHEQSPAALDARMACLDRRLGELRAFADALSGADGDVVAHAAEAADRIEAGLIDCDNVALLLAVTPPPRDPALLARVQQIRAKLDPARVADLVGRPREALEGAQAAAREAAEVGYAPVEAEAAFFLAYHQSGLGDMAAAADLYNRAVLAADRGHDDFLRAQALANLIYVESERGNFEQAHRYARMAEAAVERIGGNDDILAGVLQEEGTAYNLQHMPAEALRCLRAALAIRERGGVEDLPLARLLADLGAALTDAGQHKEAIAVQERALEIMHELVGDEHPTVATLLNNIGGTWYYLGERAKALELFQRSLAVKEKLLGADSPRLLYPLSNIGDMLREDGRLEEAMASFRRAADVWERANGPDSAQLGYPLTGMGEAELAGGNPVAAIPLLERALRLREGAAANEVGETAFALARALAGAGREPGRARALAERARASYTAAGAGREDELAEVNAWLAAAPARR